MRRPASLRRILAGACLLAGGCAQTPAPRAPAGFAVELDEAARVTGSGAPQAQAYTAAWLLYATTRGRVFEQVQAAGSRNPSGDDYLIEVRARAALADFWNRQRERPGAPPDAYLDALGEIARAGFLEEYVLATFARPGWTVPAAELPRVDLASFAAWGPEHLGELESPTHGRMRPVSGRLHPEAPGAGLPDPEEFLPTRVPCARSMPALRDAVAAWEREAAALDGLPVAAEDVADFLWQIHELASEAPYAARGITWVLPRPLLLAHVAGFCAIEVGDYAFARRALGGSVALSPRLAGPRLELAHGLIAEGRLEQADSAIEVVLDVTEDRCELGRAWRKRGYIRFEEGRLEEAREAYLRSLDFDPRSALALSELALLERELARRGGGDPHAWVPPPGLETVTECLPD